jgi:hypothetical protein
VALSNGTYYRGSAVLIIQDESDILPFALDAARRFGDPEPELIEHTIGTREAATKTTGSWVHGDELSYLIAIRGRFSAPRPMPPRAPWPPRSGREPETMTFSVLVRVVDVTTGRVTDSGGSNNYPDLASVGPVITDHRSPAGGTDPPR